jgi:hypothetical protein
MLEALSGDSDLEFPHGMAAYREEARENPGKWRWCIDEAARRKSEGGKHDN